MNPLMEMMSKKKSKPSMSSEEPEMEMDDSEDEDIDMGDDELMAAKAVMRALKGGDSAEFAKSLKGFVKMCGSY